MRIFRYLSNQIRLTRITLAIIALVIVAGFNLLVSKQLADVEPQLFQATEEAMVDTANLLAAIAESDFSEENFESSRFQEAMRRVDTRELEARIFNHEKTGVGMDVYVTDADGWVIFDSGYPERIGEDFSEKRDVYLTLNGRYGARSSRIDESDSSSSVLHVAAPILGNEGSILGVLTVYKSQADVLPILRRRVSEIWWGTGLVGGGILFCVGVIFIWQYRPISRLTEYVLDIEQGKRRDLPKLGMGKEVNTLAAALEAMRESLEGRQFAERYVQTLTHEMKSPLAAIRGAAELLNEETEKMPQADKKRFLDNIYSETLRADRLLGRLLELSVLEGKKKLDDLEVIDLRILLRQVVSEAKAMADLANVVIRYAEPAEAFMVQGDAFVLKAAFTNLLENAVDFSSEKDFVEIRLHKNSEQHAVIIEDHGEGIPEYAKERVFERFFSLRHLRSGRKGSGIGLTLVKEAAELHHANVALEQVSPKGTRAVFSIPSC